MNISYYDIFYVSHWIPWPQNIGKDTKIMGQGTSSWVIDNNKIRGRGSRNFVNQHTQKRFMFFSKSAHPDHISAPTLLVAFHTITLQDYYNHEIYLI